MQYNTINTIALGYNDSFRLVNNYKLHENYIKIIQM